MKGYNTSKDYKRLKELLDKGYEVIVYANGMGIHLSYKYVFQDGETVKYDFGGFTIFSSRFERLEEILTEKQLEFIEPTEEKHTYVG